MSRHFTFFSDTCYPAHITAYVKKDVQRLDAEAKFILPQFFYTSSGSVPGLSRFTWQGLSLGLCGGRRFSDNIVMVANQPK